MTHTSDAESLLLRFLEVEGGLHRPTARHQSSPLLVQMTSSATPVDEAVTLNGHQARRSCSVSEAPAQATACCEMATPPSSHRDLRRSSTSSSSGSSDTQEEAATPPRRSSSNQHVINPTTLEDTVARPSAPRNSIPGASPSPPLSLSHPVVQFLTSVQLQGYADRLMCDLGIQSLPDLVRRSATLKDVAALLGPSASLQQHNELLRGLRRWEREEARRARADAAEERRRARKEDRSTNGATKALGTHKTPSRTTKASIQRVTTASSEDSGGRASGRGSGTGGGRQPAPLLATLDSCVGRCASACFRLSDVCDRVLQPHTSPAAFGITEAAPHELSSDSGNVVASSLETPPVPASSSMSSSSRPSLTTSATQLMRQLSYRCSHARLAAALRRRAGWSRSYHNGRDGQGEPLDTTSRTATQVAPYDVDAEDLDAVTTSGASSRSGSNHRGVSHTSEASCHLEASVPPAEGDVGDDADAAPSDDESLASCVQQASIASAAGVERCEAVEGPSNAEALLPPATLSSACYSCESHLSFILCSLREAAEEQPVVPDLIGSDGADGEGPASTQWASAVSDTPCGAFGDALTGDGCATAESHHPVRNDLVTTNNISLSALSARAELQVLPPREPAVTLTRPRGSPAAEEAGRTATADAHTTAAKYPVLDSDATCNASQHHQRLSPVALTHESATQPRQSRETDTLLATTGASAAPGDAPEACALLERRLADAQRRLNDALQEALQSYNAEVKAVRQATAVPLTDTAIVNKWVPLRAVLQPIPFSPRASSACARSAAAAELGTPAERVVWALGAEGDIDSGETHWCSFPAPNASMSAGADTEVFAACSPATGAALDCVCADDRKALAAMATTATSAPTTMRSTAAPVAPSCRSAVAPAATVEGVGLASTGSLDAPTAAELMESRSSRDKKSEEDGSVSCESVGRLTAGTQRLSTYVNMGDAGKAAEIAAAAPIDKFAAEGRDDSTAAFLWVSQDSPSTMRQSPYADAAAADSDRKEIASTSDEWWAAYGIDALECTQNSADGGAGGRAASPSTNAVHPHTTSNGSGAVSTSRVCTPSPAPVEVIELTSGTDDEDADSRGGGGDNNNEHDARNRPSDASSYRPPRAAPSLPLRTSPPPRDDLGGGITIPPRTGSTAPMHSWRPLVLDRRLHADAWTHMTNAELRQLCFEFGLMAPSPTKGDTTSPFPAAAADSPPVLARRGRSAPLPSLAAASPACARKSAVSHESSPERDLFGLPTLTTAVPAACREPSHTAAKTGDGAPPPPEPSSPVCAFTQPENGSGGARAAVAAATAGAASEHVDIRQRYQRRATLLERESLLEALRLLATRLRFRHTVAPFFLHRVARLSGLPYKRMRAADLLDEGAVLTRDDLKQTRRRYKAEEQAEVERCIVSALVAEAAEAMEQDAQRVASRWAVLPLFAAEGGNSTKMKATPARSALASLPDGGVRCCYDQILLREPVNVFAAVAAVQRSFPHIAHTRVQQLLAANEVIAEAVVTVSGRSPSPLPQLSTTAQREGGQAIAVPRPSGELTDGSTPSMQETLGGGISLHRGSGAVHSLATTTPLSQEERQRANARHYFAQRGYMTRRQPGGWGRGRR
ncbi:hypothetical protein, conserved [Leishmania donovani]|uniref:Uncharacterized protein n=1 Tax=Leishmania donovani TaxID=5661 RepID=E9BE46_LEIDO|nr:hypothetical protein, conserved [Leishmania donovani]AYU78149.1 hypothetical protein LdCL_190010100 [Leishmania donovani]CBZ33522.1 hypothetical protein, conserved [Leishmania donovani]